ncbi:MAG: hypothetical protein F6K42_29975 [Leptolyngbya sp. SIO1D8]|nr:hypothetical protein [Leptolyngbya sp. SIO1D8]
MSESMILALVAIGTVLLAAAILSMSYFVGSKLVGPEATQRNLRYFLPWFGLVWAIALIIPTVGQWGNFSWSVFALLYVVGVIAWLLSWPLREKAAGHLLLNAGRSKQSKFIFWVGLFEVGVAAVITWVSVTMLLTFPEETNSFSKITQILFWWTVAAFFLAVGLNKLQVRENGICFMYTFISWSRMKSYRWEASTPTTLTIRMKPFLPILPGYVSIHIPNRYRDEVERIFETHIPQQSS